MFVLFYAIAMFGLLPNVTAETHDDVGHTDEVVGDSANASTRDVEHHFIRLRISPSTSNDAMAARMSARYAAPIFTHAGKSYAERFQYGVSGGATISTLGGEDATEDFESRNSFHVSVLCRYFFTMQLGMHVEGRYSRRGVVLASPSGAGTLRLDYVELAPMLVLRLPIRRAVQPYFAAGPVLSYNINAAVVYDDAGRETLELTDIHSFDPGIAAEAGVTLGKGSMQVLLGIGYAVFVNSIHAADANGLDVKNSTLLARIGLLF